MKIELEVMPKEVFPLYIENSLREYIKDRMISDEGPFAEAEEKCRKTLESLLSAGYQTPDHYFFCIRDLEMNEEVGRIWLKVSFAHESPIVSRKLG